jgi:hypothetical protein
LVACNLTYTFLQILRDYLQFQHNPKTLNLLNIEHIHRNTTHGHLHIGNKIPHIACPLIDNSKAATVSDYANSNTIVAPTTNPLFSP